MTRTEFVGTAAGMFVVVCGYFGFDALDASKPKPLWVQSHSTPAQPELLSLDVIEVVEAKFDTDVKPVVYIMETPEPPMAFTCDLDIPVKSGSFQYDMPPFRYPPSLEQAQNLKGNPTNWVDYLSWSLRMLQPCFEANVPPTNSP